MNPFECNEEITDTNKLINQNTIEIWTENRGRKTDTYIYGLIYNIDELKHHLKVVKKKFGCNGSIKTIIKDSENVQVFHIQGNHKNNMINYLIDLDFSKEQLIIKQ
jgi:translation initiation factor 1 (eIF-1/SUI1)